MPYIKSKVDRKWIDGIVRCAIGWLMPVGNLNYFLNKLFLVQMRNQGMNYDNATKFLRELHEAEHEIRRRYVAPYEDKKIKENGDI